MHAADILNPRRLSCSLCLCLTGALLFSSLARADEKSIEQTVAKSSIEAVDSTRDYVSEKFVGFVSGVDRFFGNERNFQEANQSVLQLDLNELMQQGGNRQARLALKAKLRLPATEERLHLLLESDPEKNVSDAEEVKQIQPVSQLAAPDNYGVAVRYEKPSESAWHYSSDVGIQVQNPIQPYARARLSKAVPLASWRMKVAETAFWFERTGSGETTLIDFEHTLGEPALFRASSSATWMHRLQSFDLRQDFSVFHTLDEQRALHYEASAIGTSRPHMQVSDYVLSLRYRQQLNRRWLFFEVNPQLHFPRDSNFKSTPLLLLRLEMLFDKI